MDPIHLKTLRFGLPLVVILLVSRIGSADAKMHRKPATRQQQKSFSIDYANNQFLKDGQPFAYISGSIHYFRIPDYYWRDRLLRLKAAGLNAIQFYIPWNIHEPTEGKFDFSGQNDVFKFIQTAADLDLAVILRGGPYVCGEWDFGGLPWWLATYPGIKPRSSDKKWLSLIGKWFDVLLPKLTPYLYKNGGPIILVQIENEYGSRPAQSCASIAYKAYIRDKFHAVFGYDTELITVDGGSLYFLKCGPIPAVFPTIDFGASSPAGVERAFHALRLYAPRGPLVNSEFYPGGSNFGFTPSSYVTQSYDYAAPITESGGYTAKYWAIRNFIKHNRIQDIRIPKPPPENPTVGGVRARMRRIGNMMDVMKYQCRRTNPQQRPTKSKYPMTMEDLNHPFGFVVYDTIIPKGGNALQLHVPGIKDRAKVIVDGKKVVGTLANKKVGNLPATKTLTMKADEGSRLQILVEHMGRGTGGTALDLKGIISNVTLDGQILENWTHYVDNLDSDSPFPASSDIPHDDDEGDDQEGFIPGAYIGEIDEGPNADTFFNPTGWGKGQLYINKHNIGRYWPSLGPQVTLYIPKGVWNTGGGKNTIKMIEMEQAGNCKPDSRGSCSISFIDKPILNEPIPHKLSKRPLTFERDLD